MVKRKTSKTGVTRVSGDSAASKESKEEERRPVKLARIGSKRTLGM